MAYYQHRDKRILCGSLSEAALTNQCRLLITKTLHGVVLYGIGDILRQQSMVYASSNYHQTTHLLKSISYDHINTEFGCHKCKKGNSTRVLKLRYSMVWYAELRTPAIGTPLRAPEACACVSRI